MPETSVITSAKQIRRRKAPVRVAAYVRVDGHLGNREISNAAQCAYYSRIINSHADWVFVAVYADYGISGEELARREAFNRMVGDCEDGKIDLILTKSISRFSRNAYDCINMVRKLKALGTEVMFEKENMRTSDVLNASSLYTYLQSEAMRLT